jgi:hypothetical protein
VNQLIKSRRTDVLYRTCGARYPLCPICAGKISDKSGESEPFQHVRTTTAPLWDKAVDNGRDNQLGKVICGPVHGGTHMNRVLVNIYQWIRTLDCTIAIFFMRSPFESAAYGGMTSNKYDCKEIQETHTFYALLLALNTVAYGITKKMQTEDL